MNKRLALLARGQTIRATDLAGSLASGPVLDGTDHYDVGSLPRGTQLGRYVLLGLVSEQVAQLRDELEASNRKRS